MAPPPPVVLPLPERLLALAKTLQFSWFMGHFTLLLCTIYYSYSSVKFAASTGLALFSYRLAFLSAAVTYGIVVYKAHRGKLHRGAGGAVGGVQGVSPQQQALNLFSDENVQYLIMALIWLYSKPILFALLPFAVYSTFHFLTYLRTNLIPTLTPYSNAPMGSPATPNNRPQHPISEFISSFVKKNYDRSMHLVSNLEIILFVRVFLGVLVFSNSWILFVCYATFLRLRYYQSSFVRQAFTSMDRKGDALVNDARVPDGVRNLWNIGKKLVHQFVDVTEFGTAANGMARKAQ